MGLKKSIWAEIRMLRMGPHKLGHTTASTMNDERKLSPKESKLAVTNSALQLATSYFSTLAPATLLSAATSDSRKIFESITTLHYQRCFYRELLKLVSRG